jgi:deoxyribodipyrimidine photolyase
MTTIVWFCQDLRIRDNPAVAAAAANGKVVPIFILDEGTFSSPGRLGGASRWWLHHSLAALRDDLGELRLFRGSPCDLLHAIVKASRASAVYWNRCYEPHAITRDKELKACLQKLGVEVQSFMGSLLHEPWEVTTGNGDPFKVYTAYWRASLAKPIAAPLPRPKLAIESSAPLGERLEEWGLLPRRQNWAARWEKIWRPGESGARARFDEFANDHLVRYSEIRDRPDAQGTSRLSPHLRWGEISPRQIWARLGLEAEKLSKREGASKFLSELGWREFSYHLLYHFPKLPEENWRREFDYFPWRESTEDLKAWQRGLTGFPLVDAGMRELWRTGCTIVCAWSRQASWSSICGSIGGRVRHGSGTRCSTPISPTMPLAGNGSLEAEPMHLPSSEFSIQSPRARSSILTATMFAAGARNWRAFRTSISMLRSPPRPRCWIGQALGWGRTIRFQSLTLIAHARPLSRVTAGSAARGIAELSKVLNRP